jgi:alcohol dehydrogenase, propanol-preferring
VTERMRAAVVESLGKEPQLRELPVPEPGPGQVLVRIDAAGICQTDLSLIDGSWKSRRPRFPLIPGHEGCGHVAAVGRGVRSVKEGDRVGVSWLNSTCLQCADCTADREAYCLRQEGTGHSVPGSFADYCLVAAEFAVPVAGVDPISAVPIMCAGVTAYRGLKRLSARSGDWVAVSGVGAVGHLAIQFARAMGLRVVAIDVSAERLAWASELGAELAVDASSRSPVNGVVHATGGLHGALCTAPDAKAQEGALRMLRRGGTCVLVGIPVEDVAIPPFDVVIKGLTIAGSLIGSRQDLGEAVELVRRGVVGPRVATRSIEQVVDAVRDVKRGAILGRMALTTG